MRTRKPTEPVDDTDFPTVLGALWSVVLHDHDDLTPDFVQHVAMRYFDATAGAAHRAVADILKTGSTRLGGAPLPLARQKQQQIEQLALSQGISLKVSLENQLGGL